MTHHTGASYNDIALRYAQKVDSKPMHMYYERPAVLSLLPPLVDSNVLDVGCGSGWYAEYLLNEGATVTAFDFNQDFVALTQTRIGDRASVLHADLSKPLNFASDATFDIVVCPLVMHYLHDWQPAFREFHRVLKADGVLVFSTHHPFNDWKLFEQEDYFAVTLLDDEWEDIGKVQFYRRPLTKICEDLVATGFMIEHLLEPQPTEEFQQVQPDWHERLSKNPWFLVIRARKGV